jgi:adenine-specific DNA-methyltransferase
VRATAEFKKGTPLIKYIGSKRLLVPVISEVIRGLESSGSVVDLFSGTSRVGHGLKALGYQVFANDLNTYAATLARCYVQADSNRLEGKARKIIEELNQLPGDEGYFTKTFCVESRYFQPKNGARVDAMREWIKQQDLELELEAVVLVSLMEAADRVDSTTGVQMAYLKKWAARAHNDIELRLPKLLPRASSGKGMANQMEAQEAAQSLTGDIGYLDPPYNQHKYVGNYHIWETLVQWDHPEAYGIARKRIDCRDRKSAFNSKPRILEAMRGVVRNLDVSHLVVSFSNEGYIKKEDMVNLLSDRGEVFVMEQDFKRYVGAQIGIHNPSGVKVGQVSHLSNKEYLFIVPKDPSNVQLPIGALSPAGSVLSAEVL